MPHYPDEIEYSDKYTDDYYEYRHVILPKDTYKKMPRSRLLTESVISIWCRSGEQSECSNREVGFITKFIDLNHTFFSSEEPKALILRLDYLPLDLYPHLTHTATEKNDSIMQTYTYLKMAYWTFSIAYSR